MHKSQDQKLSYLKIVPFGVCSSCLQKARIDSYKDNCYHFHCVNSKCPEYIQDVSVPNEVFKFLNYLMDHQPMSEEIYKNHQNN